MQIFRKYILFYSVSTTLPRGILESIPVLPLPVNLPRSILLLTTLPAPSFLYPGIDQIRPLNLIIRVQIRSGPLISLSRYRVDQAPSFLYPGIDQIRPLNLIIQVQSRPGPFIPLSKERLDQNPVSLYPSKHQTITLYPFILVQIIPGPFIPLSRYRLRPGSLIHLSRYKLNKACSRYTTRRWWVRR